MNNEIERESTEMSLTNEVDERSVGHIIPFSYHYAAQRRA